MLEGCRSVGIQSKYFALSEFVQVIVIQRQQISNCIAKMHLFIYVLLMAVAIRETVQQSENSTAASEVDTVSHSRMLCLFLALNRLVCDTETNPVIK